MMLYVVVPLWALLALQAASAQRCSCEWSNSDQQFPHNKLSTVEVEALKCNNAITDQKTQELDSLLLGLDRRLAQLLEDVSMLEREDDGDLYGVLSLQVIENELKDINTLTDRLNITSESYQRLTNVTAKQVEELKVELENLEKFDATQIVKKQQLNERLQKDLDKCKNDLQPVVQPTQPQHGYCPHGVFQNITGPRVFTASDFPVDHKYGAWGRDPHPEPGKQSWYWRVMLTSSHKFAHYIRLYSSLSALIVGVSEPGNVMIHSSNPTTNTVQGPNVVLYGGALYYNCYNKDAICRFNLTSKTINTAQLPQGTRYNGKGDFGHLDDSYPFTDMDLSTDESGVWVVYTTTQNLGNVVLTKVEDGDQPALGQTWNTSLYKRSATNTFMACGVLYATRYVSTVLEEIFYSFDTATGVERFNLKIPLPKMAPNMYSLNYIPVDQMLFAYCDAKLVSYKVVFEE